jgi:hypothetical protein
VAAVGAGFFLLSGCTPALQEAVPSARLKCEDAAATATSFGRATARAYANISLQNEIAEARGFLVSSGVRRVRVISRRIACEPYVLTAAMSRCVATARLCGR